MESDDFHILNAMSVQPTCTHNDPAATMLEFTISCLNMGNKQKKAAAALVTTGNG